MYDVEELWDLGIILLEYVIKNNKFTSLIHMFYLFHFYNIDEQWEVSVIKYN